LSVALIKLLTPNSDAGCANSFIVCPAFADRAVGRKSLPTLAVYLAEFV